MKKQTFSLKKTILAPNFPSVLKETELSTLLSHNPCHLFQVTWLFCPFWSMFIPQQRRFSAPKVANWLQLLDKYPLVILSDVSSHFRDPKIFLHWFFQCDSSRIEYFIFYALWGARLLAGPTFRPNNFLLQELIEDMSVFSSVKKWSIFINYFRV